MSFQLKHQYLVAFVHSEGIGRTFITTPGPICNMQEVMALDTKIENLTHFQRVQVISYQLVGTTV